MHEKFDASTFAEENLAYICVFIISLIESAEILAIKGFWDSANSIKFFWRPDRVLSQGNFLCILIFLRHHNSNSSTLS